MKRLAHVAFAHPIPIPGTHLRQADFATHDGWAITDDDGRIVLERGDLRFYTYVSASCVEAKTSGNDAPVRDRGVAVPTPSAGEGLGGAGTSSASSSVGQSSELAAEPRNPQVAGSTPASPSKRKR